MKDQNLKTKEITLLNGKLIENQEIGDIFSEPGFLCGWGLFETMRSCNNKIVYLEEHLERIKNSAKLINIKFTLSATNLKQTIKRAVKESRFLDARVRLTLWKSSSGVNSLITVKKYKPYSIQGYKKGFSLGVSSLRQNESTFLTRIKTNNRIFYELALEEAKGNGFDEALILNNSGNIAEASRSNIFLIKDNRLLTPKLENGCLDGITRRVIFYLAGKCKIKFQEASVTVQDLYNADGAFLTNSMMGIMPVRALEQHIIPKSKLMDLLIRQYQILLKNGS